MEGSSSRQLSHFSAPLPQGYTDENPLPERIMALLSSQHGGNTREAAALYGVDEAELLDFSANINPLGMPGSLRQAIIDNLALAERYPDVEYQALHARLAAHHRIPLSWVLAGNGETELIFALAAWLAPRLPVSLHAQ